VGYDWALNVRSVAAGAATGSEERVDRVLREARKLHGRDGGLRRRPSLGAQTVKLIAPEAVKPFVKKGKKNDAADAAAICEAASRPDVKFVPAKNIEQQGILALHAARSLLVKQQTMLANAMRGLATEFGITVPKSMRNLAELMTLVDADEAIPKTGQTSDHRTA
jgi:transposase